MNIYIGNLSYRVRESDLQQVLEEYGIVDSVKLIVDRDTRRSKVSLSLKCLTLMRPKSYRGLKPS